MLHVAPGRDNLGLAAASLSAQANTNQPPVTLSYAASYHTRLIVTH